jgi:hypothetical protein
MRTLLGILFCFLLCHCAAQVDGESDMIRKSWAISGILTTKGQGAVKLQKIFILTEGNKVVEDESGYYTVQFGLIPPAGTAFDTTATITFKVNGQQVVRQVSVGQGTTISGMCEAIDVLVQDTSSLAAITANVQYEVTISVIKGTRASALSQPMLKGIATGRQGSAAALNNGGIGAQTVAAGTSIVYAVPQNVGVVLVEVSGIDTTTPDPAKVNLLVQQFTDLTALTLIKEYMIGIPQEPRLIPLAPNASFVNVINNSAADSARVSVNWGIDG